MDSLENLLKKKAGDIEIEDKVLALDIANNELKRFVGNNGRVISVSDKVVTVKVKSSVLASELRLQQVSYLKSLSKALGKELTRIHIKIGS